MQRGLAAVAAIVGEVVMSEADAPALSAHDPPAKKPTAARVAVVGGRVPVGQGRHLMIRRLTILDKYQENLST